MIPCKTTDLGKSRKYPNLKFYRFLERLQTRGRAVLCVLYCLQIPLLGFVHRETFCFGPSRVIGGGEATRRSRRWKAIWERRDMLAVASPSRLEGNQGNPEEIGIQKVVDF